MSEKCLFMASEASRLRALKALRSPSRRYVDVQIDLYRRRKEQADNPARQRAVDSALARSEKELQRLAERSRELADSAPASNGFPVGTAGFAVGVLAALLFVAYRVF